jgi:pimeloyl-ACP methyl ester carboxylesterase
MTFLIPGTGGTSELFSDYRFPFPFRAVDFPAPESSKMTMKDYAEQFVDHHGITPGDSIVGMSLGGMLACEISKAVEISHVVLISSGTRSEHLNPLLRRLGFLAPVMPFSWLQSLPTPPVSRFRRRLFRMFRKVDASFLNWACSVAPRWEGTEDHPNLTQIHGDRDPVFPFSYQREKIHHRLHRASHLAVLEKQEEINEILRKLLGEGQGGKIVSPLFSREEKSVSGTKATTFPQL